ncbi:hypothetical protein P4284_06565 [Bacillus swezeyi]|uniref:hypothetical protein n=1 Tax=Bacillus swezeyi TaxID=1925020 RepID=UPI002E23A739|nr:hypothetical protein [Bacillus swezeyi]MED2976376.1 hypothetical protein [Bacillus swezeyi]
MLPDGRISQSSGFPIKLGAQGVYTGHIQKHPEKCISLNARSELKHPVKVPAL